MEVDVADQPQKNVIEDILKEINEKLSAFETRLSTVESQITEIKNDIANTSKSNTPKEVVINRNTSVLEKIKNGEKSVGNRGIKNVLNGCFMNCIYQSLAHVPGFINMCIQSSNNNNAKLFTLISELVSSLIEDSEKNPVKPVNINEYLKGRCSFFDYQQHDANEFLLYLLNNLNEELRDRLSEVEHKNSLTESDNSEEAWKRVIESQKSPIVELFFGITTIKYECERCNKALYKHEPVSFIDIPVRNDFGERPNLKECIIAEYTQKKQTITMNCRSCTHDRTILSRSITKYPTVTIMRLNRLVRASTYSVNSNVVVNFPTKLELVDDAFFQLQCVVNHKGVSLNAGHYVTYALNSTDNKWYSFDDTEVSEILSDLLCTSNAYLLFYCKNVIEKTTF